MDEADVVDVPGDVREQLADFDAALAVLAELPGRLQQVAGLGELHARLGERQRLAVVARSSGLESNVSTCDGPPFMNRKITRFARGAKCGLRRGQRIARPIVARGGFLAQQRGQRQVAESQSRRLE